MNVFHSIMHFISSGQPVPPFPPGPTPTPTPLTGDILLVIIAALLAVVFIAVCFAMKQLSHGLLQPASEQKTYSKSVFAKSTAIRKMAIVFVVAFALLGIAYVANNVFAFAQNAEDNVIQVVVDEDTQTVTPGTSAITNEEALAQKIYSVEVTKNEEVAYIEALDDVTLKVEAKDHVLFNDKIGMGHLLTEEVMIDAGETVELTYTFENLSFELAKQLVDKDAINIDVTTQERYIISYDANGATSGMAPEPQIKYAEAPLTLATNTGDLAKTHYQLTG